jgi:hypothetical protein
MRLLNILLTSSGRADNLTTFMCRLSRNLGASSSWKPNGLSRPVMELLYLYLYLKDEGGTVLCGTFHCDEDGYPSVQVTYPNVLYQLTRF